MEFNKILYILKNTIILIIIIVFMEIKINYTFYNNKRFYKIDGIRYYFLKNKFNHYIQDLPNYNHTHIHNKQIFWSWLQGVENAPDLYKACLNSIKKNLIDYRIILITNENLDQFVTFPSYILKKYKSNEITKTQFSDLLRLELLIKYSGTWLDASVLLTKYDRIFFDNNLFFFQSFNLRKHT